MNCTRLVSSCSAAASARTSSVLATPGTPSSSTWPRQSRAITSPLTAASWPTTALPTSARTRSRAARARWASPDPSGTGCGRPCSHSGGSCSHSRAGGSSVTIARSSSAPSWRIGPAADGGLQVVELGRQPDQGGVVGRGGPDDQLGDPPRAASRRRGGQLGDLRGPASTPIASRRAIRRSAAVRRVAAARPRARPGGRAGPGPPGSRPSGPRPAAARSPAGRAGGPARTAPPARPCSSCSSAQPSRAPARRQQLDQVGRRSLAGVVDRVGQVPDQPRARPSSRSASAALPLPRPGPRCVSDRRLAESEDRPAAVPAGRRGPGPPGRRRGSTSGSRRRPPGRVPADARRAAGTGSRRPGRARSRVAVGCSPVPRPAARSSGAGSGAA